MPQPRKKLTTTSILQEKKLIPNDSATSRIERTFTDELVIGICAPIGSYKEPFLECLRRKLTHEYGYEEVVIPRLSEYILQRHPLPISTESSSEAFRQLLHKIKKGDELRRDSKKNSILAEFAITDIYKDRLDFFNKGEGLLQAEDVSSRRVFYIVDSLKNKEEVKLLRTAYREIFYQFSIYTPIKEREVYLRDRKRMQEDEVRKLIATDDYEENEHGQDVRHVFTEGDFFVRMSEKTLDKVEAKVDRFLKLVFGYEIVTPLPQELAMYEAQSAAGNSACLSRQVGAAITDAHNNILSTGWNDVPKFRGGLYGEVDSHSSNDHRCWILGGYCRSDNEKDFLAEDIVEALAKDPSLDNTVLTEALKTKELRGKIASVIRKKTKIGALIEFSKAVHAEMHAIINGSQLSGTRMIGGKLYCTTFPCHNCARHIIAAGISEVYYIEPYPKSLVRLHYEAISEDEEVENKVRILMYDGVSPRRYLEFFSRNTKLKAEGGKLLRVARNEMRPKFRITLQALKSLEEQALKSLDETGLL